MPPEEHFRALEAMYHDAPCNEYYQPRLRVTEGQAEVVLPVREDLFHAAGAAHGTLYMKAIDDAAFFAASSLVEEVFVLTSNLNVELLAPVTEGEMRGVGRVVQSGGRRIVAEAEAYNGDRLVAKGIGGFVRSRSRLEEASGYAPGSGPGAMGAGPGSRPPGH